jgi:hypothetical protein
VGLIPEPYLRVTLSPLGDSERRVRIEAIGEFPPERLEALLARLKEQVEMG